MIKEEIKVRIHVSYMIVDSWLWLALVMSRMSPYARSLWSWSLFSRVLCM